MPYSMDEFCQAGRTTPRGARFWEGKGLLGLVPRRGNVRVYTEEHIRRAQIIAACQLVGMSIDEIEAVLKSYNFQIREALAGMLGELASELEARITTLPRVDPPATELVYDL